MSHQNITTDRQLHEFCEQLSQCRQIAFDTEFVSERTYRPVLCLVQVIADGHVALIDPLAIKNIRPFWEALAGPGHETVVHAGRSEVEFALRAVGRPPAAIFDVQIAAGLVGVEYPTGYGTLISKILGLAASKQETRTDWRRRPLSSRQIQYALDDIRHLPAIRDALYARLSELKRLDWLGEEMACWLEEIQWALSQERWRRVSGNSGLGSRGLAIVREIAQRYDGTVTAENRPGGGAIITLTLPLGTKINK